MKRKLLYLTWDYPFRPGEAPFVLPELKALPEKFEVRLRACVNTGNEAAPPAPCPVPFAAAPRKDGIVTVFRTLTDLRLFRDILRYRHGTAVSFRKKAGYLYWCYHHAHAFARGLCEECKKDGFIPDVGYSFWGLEGAYALILLRKAFPSMRIVSRFHGADLYRERGTENVLPFRPSLGNELDRLYFISGHGRNYWLRTYPCADPGRAAVRLLGCVPTEAGPAVPAGGTLRLFSCSSTIPLKRIDLLIRAISLVSGSTPVHWTHIGGGNELDSLRETAHALLAGKPHIRYDFTGPLPNEMIRPLYVREGAGLFISVSGSEGLPVSMMEALSVGIPLMGTDVGGVSELICADTGILLPKDPSPVEIAGALERYFLLPAEEKRRLSENACMLWSERYDADKNAARFTAELEDLCASVANASGS